MPPASQRLKRAGYRACVLFLIQRTDANLFSPNDETDSAFGEALRRAGTEGVEIYAYASALERNTIFLKNRVMVKLDKL